MFARVRVRWISRQSRSRSTRHGASGLARARAASSPSPTLEPVAVLGAALQRRVHEGLGDESLVDRPPRRCAQELGDRRAPRSAAPGTRRGARRPRTRPRRPRRSDPRGPAPAPRGRPARATRPSPSSRVPARSSRRAARRAPARQRPLRRGREAGRARSSTSAPGPRSPVSEEAAESRSAASGATRKSASVRGVKTGGAPPTVIRRPGTPRAPCGAGACPSRCTAARPRTRCARACERIATDPSPIAGARRPKRPAPGLNTITAATASPHCSSGTPIAQASATAAWVSSTSSISPGDMFSPPRTITSSMRPSRKR